MKKKSTGEAPVLLENFKMRSYDQQHLDTVVKAQSANFLEPNMVELFGSVKLQKYKKNKIVEAIKSEQAIAYFNAKSLYEMLNRSDILKVKFMEDVRVTYGPYLLATESSVYDIASEEIVGNKEVKVYGKSKWFKAKNGFVIGLEKEKIEFKGNVNGLIGY